MNAPCCRSAQAISEGKIAPPADGDLPVLLGLQNEDGFPHQGTINFVNNQVNSTTGSITMRGVFANPKLIPAAKASSDGGSRRLPSAGKGLPRRVARPRNGFVPRLFSPGMFVRVRLPIGEPHKALLIIDRAIQSDQGLKYVYVLDAQNKVQTRSIKTGPLQEDGLRVVEGEIKPDDWVVVGGIQQVRAQMEVKPDQRPMPSLAGQAEAAPRRGSEAWPLQPENPRIEAVFMISRFFIDRPIFATVLSVVITLIGGISLLFLPVAQYPRITPPGVNISISYPGASAQVVADTVGAPIEQQVNGVEGMLYMSSQSGNDGTYSLTVTFDIGTDLNTAVVKVQNRVALAMPQLPTEVQNQGITIRKKTPDILMIVNFFSPDGRYDDIYLSNYATIHVRDELLRVPGVSDITYQGKRDYSIRCWLNPQKMAACSITAVDVANAIRNQNLDAPAGGSASRLPTRAKPFELPIDTLGRLNKPEQFGDIIVKATHERSAAVVPRRRSPAAWQFRPAQFLCRRPPRAGGTTTAGTASASTGESVSSASTGGTTASGGASSSGGATTGGGATSGGGGSTGGGGTTGGAAGGGAGATATSGSATASIGVSNSVTPDRGPGQPSFGVVRLRDVARIELGAQNYNQSCSFDGRPAVGLSVYQRPDTNALEVADAVRKKMEELKSRFPGRAGL